MWEYVEFFSGVVARVVLEDLTWAYQYARIIFPSTINLIICPQTFFPLVLLTLQNVPKLVSV